MPRGQFQRNIRGKAGPVDPARPGAPRPTGRLRQQRFAELRDGWQDVLKGLRCRGCGRTHAVIPSWSLPDTSVGTAEVERYLMARERGVSRTVALEELSGRGMHAGYGKQLERRLGVIVSRGKSLWPQAADRQLGGLAWIRRLHTATDRHPVAEPQSLQPGGAVPRSAPLLGGLHSQVAGPLSQARSSGIGASRAARCRTLTLPVRHRGRRVAQLSGQLPRCQHADSRALWSFRT